MNFNDRLKSLEQRARHRAAAADLPAWAIRHNLTAEVARALLLNLAAAGGLRLPDGADAMPLRELQRAFDEGKARGRQWASPANRENH